MAPKLVVSVSAYCKMVLHAIKYPHCAVRGILLGKRTIAKLAGDSGASSESNAPNSLSESMLEVVEVVPGTHSAILAPTIETLFIHLDAYCKEEQLDIVGVYFCNQLLTNSSLDELWARIAADKIRNPVLLQIENSKLSLNATTPCLKAYEPESAGKWRPLDYEVENQDDTVSLASTAIQANLHRILADFENHLDELSAADFYNLELNAKLMAIT